MLWEWAQAERGSRLLKPNEQANMRAVKCVLRELWPAMTELLDDIALEWEMGSEKEGEK